MERPDAVSSDLERVAFEYPKTKRERHIEIVGANLLQGFFRKPVRILLHLRFDVDYGTIGQEGFDVARFERVRTNLHAALVEFRIQRVKQVVAIAPVALESSLFRHALRVVLDENDNFRKARSLDLLDDFVNPFALVKGVDQQADAQRWARCGRNCHQQIP